MPIYEYKCNKCENNFEEIVLKSDEIVTCPNCKSNETTKLLSPSRHTSGGSDSPNSIPSAPSGGGCSGCSGGNCSTCR